MEKQKRTRTEMRKPENRKKELHEEMRKPESRKKELHAEARKPEGRKKELHEEMRKPESRQKKLHAEARKPEKGQKRTQPGIELHREAEAGRGQREHWRAGNMLYPVPAVMVSCCRPGERPNIITVAWAGTVCSSPAMVSISVRPTRFSYDILRETGEFVINLTTEQLAFAADYCGVKSGRDVDKFQQMHLTPGRAAHIQAPIIEESPVNIECRTVQVLELGSHHMFVAEVLGVDVDSEYLDENGKLLLKEAGLMVYSHGEYFGLGKRLGKFGYSVRKHK